MAPSSSPVTSPLLPLNRFDAVRVLCIGDVMLDNFIYGKVQRISPEAPVPVLGITHELQMLGGAGNVLRNLVALGAQVGFISVVGDDKAGNRITEMVGQEPRVEAYVQPERGRVSTIKTRYIAGAQQLLRADRETVVPIKEQTEQVLADVIDSLVPNCDIIVCSDYAKGVLSKTMLSYLMRSAKAANKRVVVDPKQANFQCYQGASILTPNAGELASATRLPAESDADIEAAAKVLLKVTESEAIVATRGSKGMSVIMRDGAAQHFPARALEVFDVSGAGDTVLATLAIALAAGIELIAAVQLANLAAGIAVSRVGTVAVHRAELEAALLNQQAIGGVRKILSRGEVESAVSHWRNQGLSIGFTNGCFDLIHPGHIALLEQAKAACDRLIVAINSDDSVRRLKGETRPVQSVSARTMVLASLGMIDAVTVFEEDTPLELITRLEPDVLIKGADYKEHEVVGADVVKARGGKVLLASLSEGHSTTGLVRKLTGS